MKTLYIVVTAFAFLLTVQVLTNNAADATCMPNSDWPNAPCYGCPGCIPDQETERKEWNPYYEYKGAKFMEDMKNQMIGAMQNGTLENWVTSNQTNYNVWRYFYLNDQAPFFRSTISGLKPDNHYIFPPLQQLKTGIAPKDVVCKEGLQLMIKGENGSPVCLKPSNAAKLSKRGWNLVSYKDHNLQSTVTSILNSGVITLKNQTYYFAIPNYTNDAYIHPVQISFHDVLFSLFPSGFHGGLPVGGCPGQYYWADVKFADGNHELLHIYAGFRSCDDSIPIMLSNHIEPQAGLTFYDGKIRLLVREENQGKDLVLQQPSSMEKPFPRCNSNPTLEKLIREKQQILLDVLMAEEKKYGGFENRTQNLPWSSIGYDCVDNALEVGILPQFFNSDSLPKYFEKIRSIVGNTIDIVLSPEGYATPL